MGNTNTSWGQSQAQKFAVKEMEFTDETASGTANWGELQTSQGYANNAYTQPLQ